MDADCSGDGSRVCDPAERRCVPAGGCSADSDCDPDESCDLASSQCVCDGRYQLPTELGGHWPVDGVTERHYVSPDGDEFELPAGVYELIASRDRVQHRPPVCAAHLWQAHAGDRARRA